MDSRKDSKKSCEETVNVCVAVRCRPLNGKELAEGSTIITEFPGINQLDLLSQKDKHHFAFDHVFPMQSLQESVFETLGVPLLNKAFEGFNGTILAYGQTGSGKTHTMMAHGAGRNDRGLIPRISDGLYERIHAITREHESKCFLVCCSFIEIYNEVIFDLLVPRAKQAKGGLEVREQKGIGVFVKDLTEMVAESADSLNKLITSGFEQRTTAATKMNAGSSRSHCIFTIKLHQKDASDESNNTFSSLNLVDLAGSERAKSTEAEGERLKEGANINKSLSALGNVINALSSIASGSKKVFVPYRNSKLTRVLQDSLGGNSLCTMVAAISPSSTNFEETLSTLNYAKRAKSIKVTATKNNEASQVRKLQEEIETLRQKLAMQVESSVGAMSTTEKQDIESRYETQISELQRFLKQSWEDKQNISKQHEAHQRKLQEESKRAAEQLSRERQKRIRMLQESDDLQTSLQFLQSTGGSLTHGLPDAIAECLKLEHSLQSQLRTVRLFRDSAAADFEMCVACKTSDVVAMITLLTQAHAKLGSMASELEILGGIELQLEKQVYHTSPQISTALREAKKLANAGGDASDEAQNAQEVADIVTIVQRQLSQYHARMHSVVQGERNSLRFSGELEWLVQCLEQDEATPTHLRLDLVQVLRKEVYGRDDMVNTSAQAGSFFKDFGLSTFEAPDECITASSNLDAAPCARLQQALLYGGWCPSRDHSDEYLEIDLGQKRRVLGLSLQGRLPCSGDWTQTRDLLKLVFRDADDKLPTSENIYKRPPVRFIHGVGVTLAHELRCFQGAGDWTVPDDLIDYGNLSREQKVTFFEELIKHTKAAWKSACEVGFRELQLTVQDILSGKKCDETNRLLQMLIYLTIFPADRRAVCGLADVSPQWTKLFKLAVKEGAADWKWYCLPDTTTAHIFDGNRDDSTVKYVLLPEPALASKVRLHPVQWHRHVSLRCEIHVASCDAVTTHAASTMNLEDSVTLVSNAVIEARCIIEQRKRAREKEDELKHAEASALKDRAEHERDLVEQRLKDALSKIDDLTHKQWENEQRYLTTETELLKMQAVSNRLKATVEQLNEELNTVTHQREDAKSEATTLREELVDLWRSVDDVKDQIQVVAEERDLARQKEEELFESVEMKDEELMDTNYGYVYLTQRLEEKEDEVDTLHDTLRKLRTANERLEQHNQTLFDETLQLWEESSSLKTKLADKERDLEATEERYMKFLKEKVARISPSKRESGSKGNAVRKSLSADDFYEEDFDEGD